MKSEDMEVLEGLGVENILFVKGRISNPVQANPLKWFSKHCLCTSPFAAWRIRMVFDTKPHLFPFNFANVLCAVGCLCLRAQPCEHMRAICWDEIWNLEPFLRVNRLLLRRPRFQTKPSRALFHLKAARVHPYLAVHAPRRISIRLSANKNLLLHQLAGNIKLHGKRFHISLSPERPLKQFLPQQNHPLCRLICAFCEFSCLGWTCSSEPTPVTGDFFMLLPELQEHDRGAKSAW